MRHRLIALTLAALLINSMAAHATIVTIEPDDYAVGTNLSNVSSYVTLLGRYEGPPSPVVARENVFLSDFGITAPTGAVSFGAYSMQWACNWDRIECVWGLSMFFNQPVESVSLLAVNVYAPSLWALWSAFDAQGSLISNGSVPNTPGVPFRINVSVPNMAALVVGGDDGISAIDFDHLQIRMVPEPATLALFGLGLAGLGSIGRRRLARQVDSR